MGKIRNIVMQKAEDARNTLAGEAQMRFIRQVMEWEDVDFTTSQAICLGNTDPVEWEYTLGYKMSDPVFQMAMNGQVRKKARDQARENFKKTLTPEELEIFVRDVESMNTRQMLKKAMKRAKK